MFRCLAAIFQTVVASVTAGSFGILITFVFAGFVIPPRKTLPPTFASNVVPFKDDS